MQRMIGAILKVIHDIISRRDKETLNTKTGLGVGWGTPQVARRSCQPSHRAVVLGEGAGGRSYPLRVTVFPRLADWVSGLLLQGSCWKRRAC